MTSVWICTTDGDNIGIETNVGPTFESVAEPCRDALRHNLHRSRGEGFTGPLDTVEQISEAWADMFDGACIIEEKQFESVPVRRPGPRFKMVCKACGSDDVRRDAWAAWDDDGQSWELAETFDHAHCVPCGGETTIVRKPEAAEKDA